MMMQCPHCEGRKGGPGFVHYTPERGKQSGYQDFVACSTCKGTGEVTEEQGALLLEGDRLRAEEQTVFAYLHQTPRPDDWSLVLDSYEAIRRLLAPLEAVLTVWKPILEAEAREQLAVVGLEPYIAFSPGALLTEELVERGWSLPAFADRSRVMLHTLKAICAGGDMDDATAHRVGAALGTSGQFWRNKAARWRERQQVAGAGKEMVQP